MMNEFRLKQLEDAEYQARVILEEADHNLKSARKGLVMAQKQVRVYEGKDQNGLRDFWEMSAKNEERNIPVFQEEYELAKLNHDTAVAALERGRAEYERIQQLVKDGMA